MAGDIYLSPTPIYIFIWIIGNVKASEYYMINFFHDHWSLRRTRMHLTQVPEQ